MYIYIKRIIDLVFSLFGIVVLLPLCLLISLLVYINLGSPILFEQNRIGIYGKKFKMYKFRTMLNTTDNEGTLLSQEERLTKFGNKLRKTSLDELPELFNVLKGDMSLVGPRPLLVEYLELYNEEQARRHEIRPGITGWAQVNGRNAISWEEKFKLDVWYVDNYSLLLDIKILLLTIIKVIKQEGNVNVERFNGTSKTM